MGDLSSWQIGVAEMGSAETFLKALFALRGLEKFALFVAILLLVGGVLTLLNFAYQKLCWVKTSGSVLSFSESVNEESGPIADIGFEADGVRFEIKGGSAPRFIGDPVNVRYCKNDPSRAIVDESDLHLLVPIMLLGFGALLMIAIFRL